MNRPILASAFFVLAAATLCAQEASQTSPYQGTSNPPSDDTITTNSDSPAPAPKAKPRAGHPAAKPTPAPAPAQQQDDSQVYDEPQPATATTALPGAQQTDQEAVPAPRKAAARASADGTDDGMVQVAPTAPVTADVNGTDDGIVQPGTYAPSVAPAARRAPEQLGYREDSVAQPVPQSDDPSLSSRRGIGDEDEGIVHPVALPPGTVGEGAQIRVHLMEELSSSLSEKGQPFRSQVASDVLQDGQVVIPAGAEIDGTVTDVSTGHFAGHGSLRLRPEMVILENGTRYQLHAYVASAPGSRARVGNEGNVTPGSQVERDGIMYGGAVGGGAIAGAMIGGPAGALVGTIVGAGIVTTHLLVSHPQATLERGTTLILTVSQAMTLVPAGAPSN